MSFRNVALSYCLLPPDGGRWRVEGIKSLHSISFNIYKIIAVLVPVKPCRACVLESFYSPYVRYKIILHKIATRRENNYLKKENLLFSRGKNPFTFCKISASRMSLLDGLFDCLISRVSFNYDLYWHYYTAVEHSDPNVFTSFIIKSFLISSNSRIPFAFYLSGGIYFEYELKHRKRFKV